MLAASTMMLDSSHQRTSTSSASEANTTRPSPFSSFVRTLLLMMSPPPKNMPRCRGSEPDYAYGDHSSSLDNDKEHCVDYKNSLFLEMYFSFPALDETENEVSCPMTHCAADHQRNVLLPSLTPKRVVY